MAKPLTLLGLKCRPGSPFIQYLAIKAHEQVKGGVQTGAALFVSGLPPGFGEAAVTDLFSSFGPVAQAVLHPAKRSGMVVFEAEPARAAALKFASKGRVLEYQPPEPADDEPAGVKAWVQQHKALRPGNDVLQQQVDAWMEAYDAEEERKAKARQAAMAEDGWTVVQRAKGRKRTREEDGVTVMTGGAASAAAAATAVAKKEAAQPLEDFYRFQRREKRRNALVDLRQQFEEDRKRIAQLRSLRNFKPY